MSVSVGYFIISQHPAGRERRSLYCQSICFLFVVVVVEIPEYKNEQFVRLRQRLATTMARKERAKMTVVWRQYTKSAAHFRSHILAAVCPKFGLCYAYCKYIPFFFVLMNSLQTGGRFHDGIARYAVLLIVVVVIYIFMMITLQVKKPISTWGKNGGPSVRWSMTAAIDWVMARPWSDSETFSMWVTALFPTKYTHLSNLALSFSLTWTTINNRLNCLTDERSLNIHRSIHSFNDDILFLSHQMYNAISDKCVGNLLGARKHGYLTFEGEMLYQVNNPSINQMPWTTIINLMLVYFLLLI